MPIPDNQLRLVLHQVRSPDNLGAVARVMANFGYDTLVLCEPHIEDYLGAQRLGVRAEDVLEGRTVVKDLDEAIGPAVVALGTTSRESMKGREVLTPEEGLARLSEAAKQGPVALVLGGERRGLSDADLDRCQLIVRIPTSEKQPSMNLSHAAAVLLYLARHGGTTSTVPTEKPAEDAGSEVTSPRARLQTVHALEAKMRDTLLAAGFLNPQAPQHVLNELSRSLTRGALTQREAELWLTAFTHLGRRPTQS